jgi:hypothetical protein
MRAPFRLRDWKRLLANRIGDGEALLSAESGAPSPVESTVTERHWIYLDQNAKLAFEALNNRVPLDAVASLGKVVRCIAWIYFLRLGDIPFRRIVGITAIAGGSTASPCARRFDAKRCLSGAVAPGAHTCCDLPSDTPHGQTDSRGPIEPRLWSRSRFLGT